jgi:hypothetical protein
MFVAVSIIGVFLNIFAYPILNRWNEGARTLTESLYRYVN